MFVNFTITLIISKTNTRVLSEAINRAMPQSIRISN